MFTQRAQRLSQLPVLPAWSVVQPPEATTRRGGAIPSLSLTPGPLPKAAPLGFAPKLRAVEPAEVVRAEGAAIADYVRPLLAAQMEAFDFDAWAIFDVFLDALQAAGPRANPVQVAAALRVDSLEHLEPNQGFHCVGLSRRLVDDLRTLGLPAYVVGAHVPDRLSAPNMPHLNHTAALVCFADPESRSGRGYVALDPGLNVAQPLLVRDGKQTPFVVGKDTWLATYDPTTEQVVAQNTAAAHERITVGVDAWLNPDDVINPAFLPRGPDPLWISRDAQGAAVATLQLRFGQGTLRVSGPNGFYVKARLNDAAQLDAALAPQVADALHVSPAELRARVERLVEQAPAIVQVRTELG